MSSGVEVEDGRTVVVFPPPPPPRPAAVDGAGGEGRLPAPAVDGELAAAVGGGERCPGCEVTERFVMVPCDSPCICENGDVGGPGDGVGEISLRNGDGGSEPDTGGLVMANDCVADRVAGSDQAVDVEKRGSEVGCVEGVRISALHEVGSNAVDSATTALHPSSLSNSGQNGSCSDRLVGEERTGEESFTIGEVRFSKLNIGEQQNNVPDDLTSVVDVEESAAREENMKALEPEVVLASSDVAICMFHGLSHFCSSSSLPGCSFQREENRTSMRHVACEESRSKFMSVDDDKDSCDTNADLSRNVEEFVVNPGRVTEPALYDEAGKPRPLFQSSSLSVDAESTISGFHKAVNSEECSVRIINAASCNASEGSASLEISSLFGILNLTTHASEPSMGQGNSCSSPILENSRKSSLCSSLVTSLVDSCSRKNEPEGISNGTSLENSSSVAEIGSSVAEVYSPNSPSLSCRETVVDHSLPRLTRMRNAARQCRKIMEAISISVSKLRKKRSYLHRRGRSSVWGALVKIIELFEENKKLRKYGNTQSKSRLGGAKPGSSKQRRKKKAHIRGSGCMSNAKQQKTALFGCSETSDVDYSSMAQIANNNCPDKNDFKGNTGNRLEIVVAPEVGLDNFATENNVLAVEIPCDKDIESTVTQDVLVENRSDDCLGISSQIVFDSLEEATSGENTLCGTSPDSAVLYMENGSLEPNGKLFTFEKSISRDTDSKILSVSRSKDVNPDLIAEGNSIHSISLCGDEKYQEVCQLKSTSETVPEDVVLSISMESDVSVAVIPSNMLPSSTEVPCMVSNTTDTSHQMPNPDAFFNTDTAKKEKKYSRRRPVKKVNEGDFSGKLSSVSEPMFAAEMHVENCAKLETVNNISKNAFGSLESEEGLRFRKSRKAGKKQSRKKSDSVESTKGSFWGQPNGSSTKTSVSRRKKRDSVLGKWTAKIQAHFVSSEADVLNRSCVAEDKKNLVLDCGLNNGTQVVNHLVDLKLLSPQMAWVLCDDCEKWRCIPVDLANKIDDTNCKWTCKDNHDKNFADCSIPQEKSNAEINAELQLSDGSGDEDLSRMGSISASVQAKNLDAKQQASWTLIKHNLFLHRSRRTQTIDEIMVCHCKPPSDGGFGCREECLNRMLNIECVQGTCPCGNLCSNQQFQKRKYAKFKWFQCGKKGYGLQLLENVSKGQFLIEYVGEVLDMHAYEARQREYASRGQKHFYFMTLNGSEVIDACARGNLGRFINHSCKPNCWTEKWMVNGEVCIGLFALRDIKKGEEVTFDYNYVRVFGAAAKKCMCGSSGCQGYLGGDPSNSGAIVQADSDNEYPEPVMVREDGTPVINMSEIISDTEVLSISRDQLESSKSSVQVFRPHVEDCSSKPVVNAQDSSILDAEYLHDTSVNAFWQSEAPVEKGYNNNLVASDLQADIAHVTDGLQIRRSDLKKSEPKTKARISSVSVQDRERNNNISSEINHNHLLGERTLHSQIADRNYSTVKNGSKNNKDLVEHKSRRVKQSSQCKSSNPSSVIKKVSSCTNQAVAAKSKKLPVGTCGRFEGVEEKLDELLDAEGGISRSKDATKGYLKLLFVTAASGDNAIGETFQSTRDLSIILDALLKTKSRTVLHDIVNKNGLQMLHNIMKQNRRHFNRTPIIRKLLKVIEFLAAKGILTSDHIYTPPRDGVESFQDSIFELMRHGDVQVHQIARRFRDQWIPTTFVKTYSNWNGARDSLSRSCHKRWHDQGAKPSEAAYCIAEPETGYVPPGASVSSEAYSVANANENVMSRPTRIRKRKSRWDQPKETNSLGENDYDICKKRITDQMIATISESTHKHDSTPSGVNNDDAPPGFSCPSSHLVPTDPFPNCGRYAVVASPQSQYLGYLPVSYGIPWALVQEFGTSEAGGTGRWLIAPGVPFHPFPPLPSYPCEPRSLCESPEVMDSQHRESAGSSQEATASRHSPKLDAKLGRRYFRQQKWNKGNGRSPAWLRPQKNGQALKDGEHSGGSTPNSATCTDNTESEVPA